MPSESEEVWRYSPIDDLHLDQFKPASTMPGDLPDVGRTFSELVVSTLGALSGQAVVYNGHPLSFRTAESESAFSFGGAEDILGGATMVGGVQVGGDALVILNDAFLPDAVLVDVPDGALCLRDEIFGPVAVIQKFDDQTDIARLCNDTEYGLAAYVFTRDLKRGLAFAERLDFGMVGLNRGLLSDPAAPFGGMKQSGLGREGAHEGLMEFLETQYISVEW